LPIFPYYPNTLYLPTGAIPPPNPKVAKKESVIIKK
jgi:hypothetical protein